MPVHIVLKENVLTARLLGEIDDHQAREMREAIDGTAARVRPAVIRLDFSGVPFMDSSGIGLIIGRYKQLRLWGGRLVLTGMSPRIEMLVRLSGADKLTEIERGEEHAG